MQLQIVWIKPAGFLHAESLREAVEAVHFGLARLGFDAPVVENRVLPNRLPIVFGSHLLGPGEEQQIPPAAILYNLEQFAPGYAGSSPRYLDMLSRFRVWDALPSNARYLAEWNINRGARHVPLAYVPQLSRIGKVAEDIDVLFFGISSPRREAVLAQIRGMGLNVVAVNGGFGAERDALIGRAKVVLNVHFAADGKLEVPRLLYLLANRKAVVSEIATDAAAYGMQDGLVAAPYDELALACAELCGNEERRRAIAEKGFAIVAARAGDALDALRGALQTAPSPGTDAATAAPAFPRVLNLGSGRNAKAWCVNVDRDARWNPDWVLDIAQPLPLGRAMVSRRVGDCQLREGMFDAIVADHLLEHVPDLPSAMANILKLLKDGGTLYAEVPYDLSYGAWQDPHHVRAFNERSWLYFTDWHWYLGWQDVRFERTALQFGPSALGHRLLEAGQPLEDVLRQPRAIDIMRVELCKRSLPPSGEAAP